jgi:H+/gluconate symporter-like permease
MDSLTAGMIVALILVVVGMLIAALFQKTKRFRRDLNYMNMEIRRTSGSEQEYWKHEKKRLWKSLLPFCRR